MDLLSQLPPQVLRLLVVVLGAVALWQTVRLWWRPAIARVRSRRRNARAVAGEAAAGAFLHEQGYAVVGAQVAHEYEIVVDDAPLPVPLRADYLVTRGGRRLVAEVKTGDSAPSIQTAATRRQLLEYRVAYAVDGVLLVDMERRELHEVRFPLPPAPGRPARGPWPLLAIAGWAGLLYLLSQR